MIIYHSDITHLTSLNGGIRPIRDWMFDGSEYPLEGIIGGVINK